MIGFVSLGIVWMLQTISLSLYVNVTKQIPLGNIFDVFCCSMAYYFYFHSNQCDKTNKLIYIFI